MSLFSASYVDKKAKNQLEERCTFTLMTYNVNFGPFNEVEEDADIERILTDVDQARRVIDAIAEGDADVVCLQETNIGISCFSFIEVTVFCVVSDPSLLSG
jgi:hypothetical protein